MMHEMPSLFRQALIFETCSCSSHCCCMKMQCSFLINITSAAGAGAAVGSLVAVSSLSEVQHESYTEATVLLVKHIGGEEDIPEVGSASSQLLLHLTSAPP